MRLLASRTLRSLSSRPLRSGHVRASAFIEPEQTLGFPRNPNPYASANFPHRPGGIAKPQGAGGAKIHTVLLRTNPQCLCESPRTSRQIDQGHMGTAKTHKADSVQGLEC